MPGETPLSRRVRALRNLWPGRPVKQSRLAEALGVTAPSVSAYENGTTVPTPARLRDYALFFATSRWLDPDAPRRVTPDFLAPDERESYETLKAELTELAAQSEQRAAVPAPEPPVPFWRFVDGADIRLFCGQLDPDDAGPFAAVENPNYMLLRNAADLDSLLELWGHIRRLNPESDVRFVIGSPASSGDLTGHVVVIGNIAQIQGAGRLVPADTIPVTQVADDKFEGEVFVVDGVHYEPRVEDARVVEDVGLIARVPNPHNPDHTLTICSGVFTRGVYGAVRALTDHKMRDANADYLRQNFDLDRFALLTRVSVAGDTIVTPDIRVVRNRRYEWGQRAP